MDPDAKRVIKAKLPSPVKQVLSFRWRQLVIHKARSGREQAKIQSQKMQTGLTEKQHERACTRSGI